MKEKELRQHAKCDWCQKLIGQTGVPIFHTVEFVTYGLDVVNVQQQSALGHAISAPLAMHMGPDLDLANEVHREKKTACVICYAMLAE